MSDFELLGFWYDLGDGIGWNPQAKYATFGSRESAKRFKAIAPDWTVCYLIYHEEVGR